MRKKVRRGEAMPVLYVDVEAEDFEFLTHLAKLIYNHTKELKKEAGVRMVKIRVMLGEGVDESA